MSFVSLISSGTWQTEPRIPPHRQCFNVGCNLEVFQLDLMKCIFVALLLLITKTAVGQTKNIYCEIHIECVIYKGDTLKFDTPKILTLTKIGTTSIIPLGKVRQTEFAVQYELLKSNLQASEYYMLGKCFFAKTSKTWNEIARFSYEQLFIEDNPPLETIPNTNEGTCGAESDG